MNYTNAIFATFTVVPAYLLIRRLFNNAVVAFCSVLALIFNPSFFQASIYGTPHLIAFFFFLVSLLLYLDWLETKSKTAGYYLLILSTVSLTITLLLKSPLALGGGIYLGLLYLRRIKEKKKTILSLLSLAIAFILFLLLRHYLVGSINTGTTSATNFIDWMKYYFGNLGQYTFGFFKRQLKPPVLGTGIFTSVLGILIFIYFLFRKRSDVLIFVLSWAAPTYFFWLFIYGNNARHFMLGVFPVIVMAVLFFYEKGSKAVIILTTALIMGNFLIAAPSPSTYFPSGNLFKSQALLQDRTNLYHSKAQEILGIDEKKIAVMGQYHDPYVLYEILKSTPSYEAKLLTSVKGSVTQIKTDDKEFILCYISSDSPQTNIEKSINLYNLSNYIITSATYDLEWLKNKGITTRNIGLLTYEYP